MFALTDANAKSDANADAERLQGMNPERISRLFRSPSANDDLIFKDVESSIVPCKTNANCEALGTAPACNSNSKNEPPRSSNAKGQTASSVQKKKKKKNKVVLPPISALTGIKRSRLLEDEGGKKQVARNGIPRIRTTVLQGAQQINPHTLYLETLLEYHRFQLTLQPWPKETESKSYSRIITNAGLLLNQMIRSDTTIPVLPLPSLARVNGQNVVAGKFDQVIRGQLLEEIWSTLTPTSKYNIARQLRKIVNAMHDASEDKKKRNLGSVSSGPYSLLMDKHQRNTYWVIRSQPSHPLFVAFLQATFDTAVPPPVVTALAGQFQSQYKLVLSHGELSPRHIVIDSLKIVAILGWNCSGWYPEWWDYVKFFETSTRSENRDWYNYAAEIFQNTYPTELAAYQGFARCQRP